MNTNLNTLLDKYNLSKKDRYELIQIFELLPSNKKQNLLNNFSALVARMNSIQEEINIEREILIGDALSNIRATIAKVKREELKKQIKKDNNIILK